MQTAFHTAERILGFSENTLAMLGRKPSEPLSAEDRRLLS